MRVGGTEITRNQVDPWSTWSFKPAYMGESYYNASDIPGTVNAVSYMTNLSIQSVDTGTYRLAPCYLNLYSQRPQYHASASSCTFAWVWTQ